MAETKRRKKNYGWEKITPDNVLEEKTQIRYPEFNAVSSLT